MLEVPARCPSRALMTWPPPGECPHNVGGQPSPAQLPSSGDQRRAPRSRPGNSQKPPSFSHPKDAHISFSPGYYLVRGMVVGKLLELGKTILTGSLNLKLTVYLSQADF